MKKIYNTLSQLQVVLADMFKVEDKIKEIPKQLADQEAALQKTKIAYLDLHKKIETVKEEIRNLRIKYEEAGNRRESSEKLMETITQAREFETLQKEIEAAKDEEQRCRKSMLTKQNFLEDLENRISVQEEVMHAQEEDVNSERESMDRQLAEENAKLDEIKAQRDELAKDLDPNLLFKFERIIRNKGGVGIVPVHNIVCCGCHMILPAQFVNDVRAVTTSDEESESEILFCPYCSRVLFYEESTEYLDLEAENEKRAQEEKEESIEEDSGDSGVFDTGDVSIGDDISYD